MNKRRRNMIAAILFVSLILTGVPFPYQTYAKDYSSYSSTSYSWYISRKSNHERAGGGIPRGLDLSKYSAYYIDSRTKENVIYLTFDCGYENGYTPQILDTLKKHNAKALFFVTKHYIQSYPQLVKRMKKEGHLVGNHTMNHIDMTVSSTEKIVSEINGCANLMKEKTGYQMDPFLRPPQGKFSARSLKITKDLGYNTIFWSMAYYDYDSNNQPGKDYVVRHFETNYHKGAIPLIHITSKSNSEALDTVLTNLEKHKYRFGSIDEFTQKEGVLKISCTNKVYDGKPANVKVEKNTNKGGQVTITIKNSKGNVVQKAVKPGKYTATAHVTSTRTRRAVKSKKITFTISRKAARTDTENTEGTIPAAFSLYGADSADYADAFTEENSFVSDSPFYPGTVYHDIAYSKRKLILGVDVSRWQGTADEQTNVDWAAAHEAGIDFAIVRIGARDERTGELYEDTWADSHIRGCMENNVTVGVYFRSQAITEKEARKEANYAVKLLKKHPDWKVELPLAFDYEYYDRLHSGLLSKKKMTKIVRAFCETVKEAGYDPMIYANLDMLRDDLDGEALGKEYKIWIASWPQKKTPDLTAVTRNTSAPSNPFADIPYKYEFWQYYVSDLVPGYEKRIDCDFWYLDTSKKVKKLTAKRNADRSITLSCSKITGATGYKFYQYNPETESYEYIGHSKSNKFKTSKLKKGKSYTFKVRCYWKIGGKTYNGKYSDALDIP